MLQRAVDLPDKIDSEEALDELLTRPGKRLTEAIKELSSPLVVLGASGKMGPSLCVLAQHAAAAAGHPLRVVAVSRFSSAPARTWLERHGVETVACDLLDRSSFAGLPDSANVVYLVGVKFGTRDNPGLTWAINTLVPSYTAERYASARVVALSTGNVYPFTPAELGGATEQEPPAPVGEYGSAALARERIFEFYARRQSTPTLLLRLNYAVELRYGVLLDIAQKVWARQPIDLGAGHLNCLWQGDANDAVLRSFPFSATPAAVLNLTGPGVLRVRDLAHRLGMLMEREPQLVGTEAQTALLNNAQQLRSLLGPPAVTLEQILPWTAHWVMQGHRTLGKPTHFEVRSGQY
jgi:nucleoside-diphosphate-sugar epimerase